MNAGIVFRVNKSTIRRFVLVLSAWCFCSCANGATDLRILDSIIDHTEKMYSGLPSKDVNSIIGYLKKLRSDFDSTIQRNPKEFPDPVANVHQSMQFYFFGRTKFEDSSVRALCHPPVPLTGFGIDDLSENSLSSQGWAIRCAWFRLWSDIRSRGLMDKESEFKALLMFSQYVRELSSSIAVKAARMSDLDALVSAYSCGPVINPDYIQRLVNDGGEKSFGEMADMAIKNKLTSAKNRGEYFKILFQPLYLDAGNVFECLYFNNPAVFSSRMTSVVKELRLRVTALSKRIKALPTSGGKGNNDLVSSLLDPISRMSKQLDVLELSATGDTAAADNALSHEDIKNVEDIARILPSEFSVLGEKSVSNDAKNIEANINSVALLLDKIIGNKRLVDSKDVATQLALMRKDFAQLNKFQSER
ncbi:MAG: hypothetical protein ACFUZC_05080 [Chthoniobacteraceae bacterium]